MTSDEIIESARERADRFDLERRALEVAKVAAPELSRILGSTSAVGGDIAKAAALALVKAEVLIEQAIEMLREEA